MPFVVITLSMLLSLVLIGPSDASAACVSRTDARQHSGSVHIYRHGQDHCWDAVPTRGNQINGRANELTTADDSMPAMLPEDARWIDVDQGAPSSTIEREPEPTNLPPGIVLVAIAIAVTLGTIEAMFRATIPLTGGGATGRDRGRP